MGCSKSNASSSIMSVHRGKCCWYGSRCWTFTPIFGYRLLLHKRWQQRGSLTEWHLTWKCGKKGTHWHSLMLAERLRRLNGGCEHSEEVGGAFQQWQQRSPPLMQIFTSAACRLLFITGENVQLMVVVISMEINQLLWQQSCTTIKQKREYLKIIKNRKEQVISEHPAQVLLWRVW